MLSKLPVLALTALALSGCAMLSPAPPKPVAYTGSPQERWVQGQKAYEAWSAGRRGWTTTPSGLQYHRVKAAPASAAKPSPGAVVTIHYVGKFIDGREFDPSRARKEPAPSPLNRIIRGWGGGVPMMGGGETGDFVIPSAIAYGGRARPPIPPGSTLLFEIELIAIPS